MTSRESDIDLSDDDQTPQRHRGRRAALWSIGGLVVLAGAYIGVAAWKTGTVPDGTTVGGVDIGGLTHTEAQDKIDQAMDQRLDKPITVSAQGKSLKIDPAKAGMSFDTSGALDGLTGFTLVPTEVLDHFTGGPTRSVKPTVDRKQLASAVRAHSNSFKGAPKNGSVEFNRGKVDVVRSTPGTGLDTAAVTGTIAQAWPDRHRFEATVSKQPAPLTNKEIDTFVKDFAKKAMSGPVTVKVGDRTTKLSPEMISGVLSAKVEDGKITPKVDSKDLDALLHKVDADLVTAPTNAKVTYKGGEPKVIPAKDGTAIVTKGADKDLLKALTASDRTMTLDTTPVKPEVTTAQVKKDVKKEPDEREQMSKFVSEYPTGPQNAARTHNIKVALKQIDGMYVAPGEQFSLLDALTPITAANGYVNAPVLVGGVDVPGMGGGISQVSTTLYNATFFAGLQLDEHTAHGYWISRYPMGREATLWVPTIDNKWTNDSGHGIVINAYTQGNAAVIELLGKDVFTVTSHTGEPFNIEAPGKRVRHVANCIPQPPVNGFDVTVTRTVKRGGKVVKNESLTTHYNPADRVICAPPK